MKDIQDKPMMRQKGYTLIELLTTLGVASVLVSMAVRSMQSFRMNYRQSRMLAGVAETPTSGPVKVTNLVQPKYFHTLVTYVGCKGILRGRKQKMSGFTLYDIMMALAIGGVVVSMGVPSFGGVLDNQRMTSATNELVMSLNLAKSEAIKRVTYVSVCKSSNGLSCGAAGTNWDDGWIVFANAGIGNLGSVDPADEIILVSPALRDTLTMTPIGSVEGFVSFRPTGTIGTAAANLTGTLTLCDERGAAHARGVLLDSSGRWRVSTDLAHDGSSLAC